MIIISYQRLKKEWAGLLRRTLDFFLTLWTRAKVEQVDLVTLSFKIIQKQLPLEKECWAPTTRSFNLIPSPTQYTEPWNILWVLLIKVNVTFQYSQPARMYLKFLNKIELHQHLPKKSPQPEKLTILPNRTKLFLLIILRYFTLLFPEIKSSIDKCKRICKRLLVQKTSSILKAMMHLPKLRQLTHWFSKDKKSEKNWSKLEDFLMMRTD